MLRVLIADDHAIVRRGLKDILREADEPATVGEASSGEEVLAQVRAQPWDVVILDITMPGLSGIAALKILRAEHPALPVIMLSMHTGPQYVVGSLHAGASGYLSKETAPEELVTAIAAVLSGERYVSHALAEKLRTELARVGYGSRPGLSSAPATP